MASAPAASLLHCTANRSAATKPGLRPLRRRATAVLARQLRQIETLAGQDPVRTFFESAAIGLEDAAVARARAIVALGDRPQGVALLDHVPAGNLSLDAGKLAAVRAAAG